MRKLLIENLREKNKNAKDRLGPCFTTTFDYFVRANGDERKFTSYTRKSQKYFKYHQL